MKIVLDFEKCTITMKDTTDRIKLNGCKKYTTNRGWEVVVYCEYLGGDMLELVLAFDTLAKAPLPVPLVVLWIVMLLLLLYI